MLKKKKLSLLSDQKSTKEKSKSFDASLLGRKRIKQLSKPKKRVETQKSPWALTTKMRNYTPSARIIKMAQPARHYRPSNKNENVKCRNGKKRKFLQALFDGLNIV